MAFGVRSNIKKEAQFFRRLRRDVNKTAMTALDQPAKNSVKSLKEKLRAELRSVNTRNKTHGKKTNPDTEKPQVPKFETDFLQHILGKNYEDLRVIRKPDKYSFPTNFGSGYYVTMNGRFEVTLPLQTGLTARDYKNKVKESFKDSIIVDSNTGKTFLMPPDFTEGMKLKCSHGDKNDTERLDDLVTSGKSEVTVTAYKSNFQQSLNQSLPLSPIMDMLLEGQDNKAKDFLKKYNHFKPVKQMVEKVEELKEGEAQEATPDVTALNNARKLINNLKIKKTAGKNKVTYTLVSSYSSDGEQFEQLYSQLKSQISMWLIRTQDELVQILISKITKVVQSYGRG